MPKKGGRRKKTRTHVDPESGGAGAVPKVPRSFVVRRGKVDGSVAELVNDMRQVMAPNTAARLKERKVNAVKDYVAIAGPLLVTHLMMFTQSKTAINLHIGRMPRGPTVSFKVLEYSLMRQVHSVVARPIDPAKVYNFAPLVVLNNFADSVATKKFLSIVTVTLQNMFPAIDITSVNVADCKRVVLFHYHPEEDVVDFRHYGIRTAPVGLSRGVKRVVQTRVPDLSKVADISDFVLGGGGGGGSDSEAEDAAAQVELPAGKRKAKAGKSGRNAVKMVEIGPRMRLKVSKITGGLAEGDVLYHAFVEKSASEATSLKNAAKERARLKAERKAVQAANVEKKKAAAAEAAEKKAAKRAAKLAKQQAAAAGALSESEGEDEDGAKAAAGAGASFLYDTGSDGEDAASEGEEEEEEKSGSEGEEEDAASDGDGDEDSDGYEEAAPEPRGRGKKRGRR